MKTKNELRFNLVILLLIVAGISTRFFLNIPNFTAIGAIALFSGAYFSNKKLAFIMPLSILFISDLFIGFHKTMAFVYISFVLILSIGLMLRNNKNAWNVLFGSLAGSVLFFMITNFGVWFTGMGISPDLIGVYRDGIPFFRYTLAGDLVFNAVLFTVAHIIFEKSRILSWANER